MIHIAYVGPDWVSGFTKHVISRGPIELMKEINEAEQGVNVFRATRPADLHAADAVLLFHHSHSGYKLYEPKNYVHLMDYALGKWHSLKQYRILWHVEPIARYATQVSQQATRHADTILYSSVQNYHFYEEYPNLHAKFIYCGNPCFLEPQSRKLTGAISAPMNVAHGSRTRQWQGNAREYDIHGSRLELMKRLYGGLPVEVHCFGDGWKQAQNEDGLPDNFRVMGIAMDATPYCEYPFVLELAELDRIETLNNNGWNSDRLGWSLSYWCNFVTNMEWTHQFYASTWRHTSLVRWIRENGCLPIDNRSEQIETDRRNYSYKAWVGRILPELKAHIQEKLSGKRAA